MYKEEYEMLNRIDEKVITAEDLLVKLDRTLLYGYTCERDTFHVYIQDNKIHKVIYKFKEKPVEYEVTDNYQYVPDKRLYPECCDYEFCRLLKERGITLPFTTWSDREKQIYYEDILEQLPEIEKELVEKCISCGNDTKEKNLKVCDKCASEYKF